MKSFDGSRGACIGLTSRGKALICGGDIGLRRQDMAMMSAD